MKKIKQKKLGSGALTKLEKRLLCNFVLGDRNKLYYPTIDDLETHNNEMSVNVKIGLKYANLNNFGGNKEKYKKALDKLAQKLC